MKFSFTPRRKPETIHPASFLVNSSATVQLRRYSISHSGRRQNKQQVGEHVTSYNTLISLHREEKNIVTLPRKLSMQTYKLQCNKLTLAWTCVDRCHLLSRRQSVVKRNYRETCDCNFCNSADCNVQSLHPSEERR